MVDNDEYKRLQRDYENLSDVAMAWRIRCVNAEATRDAAQAEATRQTLLAREYKMVADAAVRDMAALRQSLEGAVMAARNV